MKNFNKILALVLALMMLISVVVVVPASAAEVTYNTTALERLVKLGIYKGYGANELGEKDDVTREQMAMFVARVMTGKVSNDAWANFVNDTPFKDIADRPAVNIAAIAYAYDEGVIIGRSADVYGPKDNVTYQEALTMVVRALLGYKATKDFKYPEGFINAANLMGLTDGVSGVKYNEKAIRGVTATILYNALTVEYEELVWTGMWPWPTLVPNTFANKFNLSTGKYMLTSVTEVRNKAEFTLEFNGNTNTCVDGDYVVFTELEDDVTFATDAQGALVDRTILATELADDLGADLATKIGYVYDLTFEGEKLAWVDEYEGTTYRDYGKTEDKIAVNDANYLVVDGQKYDWTVNYVDLESKNPTKVYDLILVEYNPAAITTGVAFQGVASVADIKDNMFQEVTMFDTNRDGMYDYAIYMPYYIGNYITSGDYFVVPSTAGDYTFQRPGYFADRDKVDSNKKAAWNTDLSTTYNTIYVYTVNPASMDIKTVEKFGRDDFKGEVTKVVNDALTKEIKSATVGGKEFTNINKLTDANLKGISGLLAFEEAERMPTALVAAGCGVATWENVFQTVLESNGAYKDMRVYSLAGYTLYAWPSIVRNYNFVTFDWADAVFSIEGTSLVVDRALTDASGNYTTVKIDVIYNENGDKIHTFDNMEWEAFIDTIDALYANPDQNQYGMYFNDARKAAIMATSEYAKQLRINIMEEINGAVTGTPELYAITGTGTAGNLALTDVDADNAALVSYATALKNNVNCVKAGTIEFVNGIAVGQFATNTRNESIVSKAKNIVVTNETVFTFVAEDGIFTFTGKPDNGDQIVLTADTFIIAANAKQIMVVDKTRSINEIAIGDVEYIGKFLDVDSTWFNSTIKDTWAFNENTNNCPMGFKWLVDAAYLITSDTKLETVALTDGVVLYTYTNLYDLVACKNVEKTFAFELDLVLGNVVIEDRVLGIDESKTLADAFHVYGANNVNWTTDTYVGKLVSGSTVGYYEFTNAGKLIGVTPSFVIITITADKVTVTTDISKLAVGAEVAYTMVNGVPTGYAVQ